MAVQQQQLPSARFVDLPELPETFADSIHKWETPFTTVLAIPPSGGEQNTGMPRQLGALTG